VHLADVFVDAFTYNAHATAMDSLWGALPLLGTHGVATPSRQSASVLAAAGLGFLTARNAAEYERMLMRIVESPSWLQAAQAQLERRESAPLFDVAAWNAHFETGVRMALEVALHRRPAASKAAHVVTADRYAYQRLSGIS
jgi:predicted O-linked N-acetylglucosamine transferase (SPINDLY family)